MLGIALMLATPGTAASVAVDLNAPTALYAMYRLLNTTPTEPEERKTKHAYLSEHATDPEPLRIGGMRQHPLRLRVRLQRLSRPLILRYLPRIATRRAVDQVRQQDKSGSTRHRLSTPTSTD